MVTSKRWFSGPRVDAEGKTGKTAKADPMHRVWGHPMAGRWGVPLAEAPKEGNAFFLRKSKRTLAAVLEYVISDSH